ncbi:Rrf2 family transcriptional regulator [bacterium]|nr:Rrf2 family transcriptional regulator [bacterium]
MRMSDGVEWGLHSVWLLSQLPEGAVLAGKTLAEFHGVSESYLLKHLKALVAARILGSVPGPRGGYRLARPTTEVSFLDVARAIEGPEPAFRCTEIRQRGPIGAPPEACRLPCSIHRTMSEAEAAWMNVLKRRTIADLTAELLQTLPPERQQSIAAWLEQHIREGDGKRRGANGST